MKKQNLKKSVLSFLLLFASLPAFAATQYFDVNGAEIGIKNQVTCGTGITCSIASGKLKMISATAATATTLAVTGTSTLSGNIVGDGGDSISGFLQNMVAATATTITAAQCGGTFYNSGAVAINLPEASAVIGCRLTFITANASNFDVNPDDADQILILTNAAGDSIRNATLGNSVVLQAISASQWAPVAKEQGTYTDIN
jgi:hypothetical protein